MPASSRRDLIRRLKVNTGSFKKIRTIKARSREESFKPFWKTLYCVWRAQQQHGGGAKCVASGLIFLDEWHVMSTNWTLYNTVTLHSPVTLSAEGRHALNCNTAHLQRLRNLHYTRHRPWLAVLPHVALPCDRFPINYARIYISANFPLP